MRHQALVESLRRVGLERARAETYATIATALLAGLQVTGVAVDENRIREVFVDLALAFGIELPQINPRTARPTG